MKKHISLILLALILCFGLGISTVQAVACVNNNWQPTFVHDLDNEDGPWYVTSTGQFVKLRIVNNQDWTPHACDLIRQGGIRNTRGYTDCRQYTRIQCGCRRGLSETNLTCASFLRAHNNRFQTLPYQQATDNQDVMRHQNPVMVRNNCTCEDWDNNGLYGVVLNGEVLRSNVGSYNQCEDIKYSLQACNAPDVMRNPNPVIKRTPINASIESQEKSKHVSGGYPGKYDHYVSNIKYSILNTSNKDVLMTSGWYEVQDGFTGKIKRHGANYPHTLKAGKKYIGGNRCVVPHNQYLGTIVLGGSGYYRNDPDKKQFEWTLKIECGR